MASSDTLNQRWANDKSKFGYQMLLKMGWTEGRGAGKNEDGISSHIKVKKRTDRAALGAEDDTSGNSAFIKQIDNFSAVLANLNASHGSSRKRARASDDETDSRGTDSDADSAAGEASEPRKKDKAVGRKKRKADKGDDKADKKKKKKAKKAGSAPGAKGKKTGTSADLERVAAQAPELLTLLSELKDNLDTLDSHVAPVLGKVRAGELPTSNGVSYLEAKFQAMLTYCINIAFYLHLKAKGEAVREHPVIAELVRVRSILERLKPLDIKLKGQLDELLAAATSGARAQSLRSKARPNIADLMDDDDDEGEESEAESDVEEPQDKRRSASAKGSFGAATYRAPREMLVSSTFEEDERSEERHRKKQAKLLRKLKKNQLLQELNDEFTDRPSEMPSIGATMEDAENRRIAAERQKYEDENFVRLRETKKERAERRQRERDAEQGFRRSLEELENFGDLEGMVGRVGRDASRRVNDKALRQQELNKFMAKIQQQDMNGAAKKKKSKAESGDQDVRIRDPMALQDTGRAARAAERALEEDESRKEAKRLSKLKRRIEKSNPSLDQEDDIYREATELAKKKKRAREERNKIPDLMASESSMILPEGAKRRASRTIIRNQGLHAHKKKEDRNPRVRRRLQYEKKLKARKGQVLQVRDSEAVGYGGESTGLRTNLVASRRPGK
mmetsp:Transcript_14414/g.36496  ORF Transcript_14414/g.36496 Transcript_14414/m.36496 type:complete len:677 (+) Transcript_14414:125-2155(+)